MLVIQGVWVIGLVSLVKVAIVVLIHHCSTKLYALLLKMRRQLIPQIARRTHIPRLG